MRRTKIAGTYAAIAVTLLLGAGCGNGKPMVDIGSPIGPKTESAAESQTESDKTGIANPASTKCAEDGLRMRILNLAEGQVGICTFDDGSECEEWAYFRGDCRKGQCRDWITCQSTSRRIPE